MVTYQDREKCPDSFNTSSHDDEDTGILADSIRTHTNKKRDRKSFQNENKRERGERINRGRVGTLCIPPPPPFIENYLVYPIARELAHCITWMLWDERISCAMLIVELNRRRR